MAKVKAKARRDSSGNVTFDLGEQLERRLRQGGMAGKGPGERALGLRGPGWGFGKPTLGARLGIPQRIDTGKALGGGLLGAVGNRLLRRVTPGILGTDSELAVDGVNALAGIVPFVISKNDMTVGIALPGILQLAFDLTDVGLDALGLTKPALAGDRPWARRPIQNPAAGQYRQNLANLQGRLQAPARPQAQWPRPVRVLQPAQ